MHELTVHGVAPQTMQRLKRLRWASTAVSLLALLATVLQPAFGALTREPYLQQLTPNTVTIMWQTDLNSASNSQVQYGTSLGNLNQSSTSTAINYPSNPNVKNHAVTITSLTPNTKYFYNVGTVGVVEGGGTADYFWVTAPPVGSTTSFRAWVLADSSDGSADQRAVRDAMLAKTASSPPDLVLHGGDIAYNSGTDTEFTNKHFAVYENILRHTPLFPALGNHEAVSVNTANGTGPYYEAHTLPTAAEMGGVASGTEAYYSFDYANVHFIVLDSMDNMFIDSGEGRLVPSQAMMTWLNADLASTLQDWVVAIWHHPPYSKGTHDSDDGSDSGGRLVAMREDVLPILEAGGVDLVIAGHSHIYERSYLIDGAYGYGANPNYVTPDIGTLLSDGHILDLGNGDPAGDGAYIKNAGAQSNQGTVYVVVGHGGRSVRGPGGHPVMAYDEVAFGSVIMDVADDTVTLRNLNSAGVVTDTFRIAKGSTPPPVSGFTAYNDLAWGSGQLSNNITTYTSPNGGSGLGNQGELIDFDSGLGTGVNLAVTGGRFDGTSHSAAGPDPTPGTDAYAAFNGKVSGQGHISYLNQSSSSLRLTFAGLDVSETYDLVFYAHRDSYGWNRASLVTLSGQDSFTNNSSTANDNPNEPGGVLFSGPSDPSTRLPADNDNGYVARFDNVDPGSDGEIVLTVSFDGNTASQYRGKYASALMLRRNGGGSAANQPPAVNAGTDQTITLPSSANLDGTISDDGLPSGTLTTTWSRVSGPGTVIFGDHSAVDTTATFSTDGTYVLRLTADDSDRITTDDVTIVVNPAGGGNQVPAVNAGTDQTITLPSNANLDGTVGDDGLPGGTLTTTWTQVSGLGTVTFADPSAVDTSVSFSTAGDYVLRLSADDGQLQSTDDIAINVNSAGPSSHFTAYNDLAWGSGQLSNNITTYTSPNGGSGLGSQGELIDFDSGLATGVNLAVTGGTYNGSSHAVYGTNPAAGTDAYDLFDGKVSGDGAINYVDQAGNSLVLTFTGLNPGKRYDLAFYAHRDKYPWNRAFLATLSGQVAFTNNSSTANDNPSEPGGVLFSGPGDPSTRLPPNNDNGYLARFDNIDPGSDGEIVLTVSFDGTASQQYRGKHGSAVMLRAQ